MPCATGATAQAVKNVAAIKPVKTERIIGNLAKPAEDYHLKQQRGRHLPVRLQLVQ